MAKSPEYVAYLRKATEAQHAAEDAERNGADPALVTELTQYAKHYQDLAHQNGRSRSKPPIE